jgi:hypothetical protein
VGFLHETFSILSSVHTSIQDYHRYGKYFLPGFSGLVRRLIPFAETSSVEQDRRGRAMDDNSGDVGTKRNREGTRSMNELDCREKRPGLGWIPIVFTLLSIVSSGCGDGGTPEKPAPPAAPSPDDTAALPKKATVIPPTDPSKK